MENKKIFFGVDASAVKIKELLNKEFLELSLKAISDEKPNRNNTWFTLDSLNKGKESFYNKPILGYFKNNDFVSHNGKWDKDLELNTDYWDTTGEGERCIGLIRESDNIEVIEDANGIHWITLSCALWTSYCYKQVKRLLKDALRAQKTGGLTKNISVEVDLTDYEEIIDDKTGKKIVKINSFELVGVTILGSRNGVKVEPGIEGAGLSVVDVTGRNVFDRQEKALRLAYEKLDSEAIKTKEEFSQMNEEQEIQTIAEEEHVKEVSDTENAVVTENFEQKEEAPAEGEESVTQEEQHLESEDVEVCPTCGKNPCECESCHSENEEEQPEENKEEEEVHCEEGTAEEKPAEEEEHNVQEESQEDCRCAELEAKCCNYEAQLNEANEKINSLNEQYSKLDESYKAMETMVADYEVVKNKLHNYEHKEFLGQAGVLIASAKLDEEVSQNMYNLCDSGEINSLEDLKIKVAVKAFEANTSIKENVSFNTPISTPDTTTVFEVKNKKVAQSANPWDDLHSYIGK